MTSTIIPPSIPGENLPADLLRQRLGIVIPAERLAVSLRRLGYLSPQVAYSTLRDEALDSAAWQRLLRELAIGETYFFRDVQRLEAAIQTVYTQRAANQNQSSVPQTFTAWSAGCATGEEVYTLVRLLQEVLPPQWVIHVIGTDINIQALATARRGVYGTWSFRRPEALIRGELISEGTDRWRVPDAIRALVEFRQLNLTDPQAIYPTADLIVCRNVLLYLTPSARRYVRDRLPLAIITGGVLVIDDTPLVAVEASADPSGEKFGDSVDEIGKPALPLSLYERARALTDQGQSAAALALLDSGSPLDLAYAWLRAQIYMQGLPEADYAPIEVMRAVQRCLYIDPAFALGYVALGNLYAAQGDQRSARRQWANAARITASIAPDDVLPFGEGLTAGDLQAVIGSHRRDY